LWRHQSSPQVESGARQYTTTLMNIRRVEGMSGIAETGNLVASALTAVAKLPTRWSPGWRPSSPGRRALASDQIRNAATLGGNICNASPAGDMINPLLVLDAEVELARWQDGAVATRRVAMADFFLAPRQTAKRDGELLTAVFFARPATNFVACFRKSGPRPALEISTVSVGIGGRLDNGVFRDVRVAMGSVAPTPLRARHVEAALEGKRLDADGILAAVAAAKTDAKPIDDVRASAWYREHLVQVFTEEVLNHVLGN
jgi:CO/xanthine dehydrogenase FAD-binding subunit